MRFIPHSPGERQAMLQAVGAETIDGLFASVPREVFRQGPAGLPPAASEIEIRRDLGSLAAKNAHGDAFASFLGAGLYAHYTPAFVSQLLTRGEFLTAYTPYQPEVSQGTLTAIYEFQTHVALLTEMDIANASMYEGASAFVEAVLMGARVTKGRGKVVVSEGVHPEYRRALRTYLANFPFTIVEVPLGPDGRTGAAAMAAAVDKTAFAVGLQSPNILGVVEDWATAAEPAKASGALSIAVINELFSLGLLRGPGAAGCDVACGEAASFGIPPSFGGPLVGFLSCKDAYKRQMPGRLCGLTVDADGQPAFCLTLSTREQHIRREKATSNICTNQGLFALAATMTLGALGKEGIREAAHQSFSKAEYFKDRVRALPKPFALGVSGPTFNEFAIKCGPPVDEVLDRLEKERILGGVALGRFDDRWRDLLLVATTELSTREAIDRFVTVLEGF